MANPQNYTDLVEEIETVNAYLSDEAAIEFMQKDVDRPVAKAVALIANSPLPKKAKQKIDDMDLSENLKNLLKSYQNGMSKRELKEQEIETLKQVKRNFLQHHFQKLFTDSTLTENQIEAKTNEYIEVLSEQAEWTYRQKALSLTIKMGKTNQAQDLIASMQQNLPTLEPDYAYHNELYLQMMTLQTNLIDLDSAERASQIQANSELLEELLEGNYTDGKTQAALLLDEADIKTYTNEVLLPKPKERNRHLSQGTTPKVVQTQFDFTQETDIIEVYPNPAKDVLVIEFLMFNGQQVEQLGIYDLNGRLLQTQKLNKAYGLVKVNVNNLPSGTYIVAFGTQGISKNAKKFVVKR